MIGAINTSYSGFDIWNLHKKPQKDVLEEQKKQQIIAQLKQIEQKVIAHEQAHKAAGGELAGPIHYRYTVGPDGKRYIVGGEVPIKIHKGKTPEETIKIAQQVRAAALAPADPSPQDLMVAQKATVLEMQARVELLQKYTTNSKTKHKIDIYA